MRRTLVVLAIALPLMRAQNTPVTLGITAAESYVVAKGSFPNVQFSTAPGSVKFTLGSATATLTVQAPPTITGTDNGLVVLLNPPASITMNLTGANFNLVQANFFSGEPGCLTFFGTSQGSNRNTDTCPASKMSDISGIRTNGGFFPGPAVELIAQIDLSQANSVGAGVTVGSYEVHFQWTVGTGCPAEFDRIEVIQAIHEDKYPVPLIARKPTVARLFLKLSDPSKAPVNGVTAELRGTVNGNRRNSSPKKLNGPITVKADNPAGDKDASLNFQLPDDWIFSSGDELLIDAEATLPACQGSPAKVTGSTTVSFTDILDGRTKFKIGWVSYCYPAYSSGGPFGSSVSRSCPDETLYPKYTYLMRKLYPIPPGDIVFDQLHIDNKDADWKGNLHDDTHAGANQFNAALNKLLDLSEGQSYDQLVGFLPHVAGPDGASDPWYRFGQGKVLMFQQYVGSTDDAGLPLEDTRNFTHYNANTLIHEIGHNLGRTHPGKPTLGGVDCGGPQAQSLFQSIANHFTNWPYATSDIQELGFDPETGKLIPKDDADYMSYCLFKGIQDWTAPYTYSMLAKGGLQSIGYGDILAGLVLPLVETPGQPRVLKSGGERATRTRPHLASPVLQAVISGWAARDGSASGLDPIYQVTSSDPPPLSDNQGTHCLRFTGSATPVPDYCFTLSFEDSESGEPLKKQYFAWKVPAPAGVTGIALVTGGNQIAALTATSAPPALSITTPKPGDQWNGSTQTISWTASDPDGMPLVFTVLYSADGGQSWLPMGIDITDSQFTFNASRIDGGKNVIFRVMGSDGLNSTSVDVGPIEVVQVPMLQLDKRTVDFGNRAVGQIAEQNLTITNPGTGPLMIKDVTSDNDAFQLSLTRPPFTVPAGGRQTMEIQWKVDAVGPQTATWHILSTDPGQPAQDVKIQGIGVSGGAVGGGSLAATPASLDFGSTSVAVTKTVTLKNTGATDLTITQAPITPTGAPFSLLTALPFTVRANGQLDISVRFAPSVAGPQSATLAIGSLTILLTGTAATGPPPTGGSCFPPPANVVSWWPGDGSASDASGGNNLTLQGGANFAAGQVGQAFQFDGSAGYATAGNPANLRLTSAITIEAWIYPRSAPTTGNMQAIVTKWAQIFNDTADADSYGLWLRNDSTAGLTLFGAIHQAGGNEPHVLGGTIALNAWTHVAMTFDATTGQFIGYINGQPVSTLTAPGPILTSSRNVFIGREDSILPRPFNGLIDEVAVYSRALSASEIQGIHNAGSAGKCKGTTTAGALAATPASLDFGSTSTSMPVTKTVTLKNPGTTDITIAQAPITPAGSPFSVVTTLPFTVRGNSQLDISIRFAPTAAGAQSATLAIGSLSIPLTGTGTAASVTSTTLSVDSNTFATGVGLPGGATDNYFVNRLTPPGYPATLRQVQVVFSNGAGALPGGSAIKVLSGSNPSGSGSINGISLTRTAANITAGQADSFNVAPITITSGDFVVGFETGYPAGVFPAVLDISSPPRLRSYFSTDGATFTVLDAASGVPGNLGIRAVVDLGGSGGGPVAPQIAATPATLDFGSVPVGQQPAKTLTLTIRNSGGGALTITSLGILDNPLFSIVQPPPAPFDVPASGVTITVQFTPVAAFAGVLQKGTLLIGSNDPAHPTPLALPITGTGISSSGGPAGCVAPPANQVSWFGGDGNANDATGGNNGSLQGGATFAAGEVGQAFQFDGSTGYVTLGNPSNLRLTSAITIEAWINPRSAPTSGNMEAIVTKWAQNFNDSADSDSYGLWFRNDAGAGLTLFGAIHQPGGNEPHVLGGNVPLNTWTHVAMTFDSASGQFTGYVNGQPASTLTSPGPIIATSHNVFIGREDSSAPRPFNGLIDEIAIYSRALSAAEIQGIFNAGSAGKCKAK